MKKTKNFWLVMIIIAAMSLGCTKNSKDTVQIKYDLVEKQINNFSSCVYIGEQVLMPLDIANSHQVAMFTQLADVVKDYEKQKLVKVKIDQIFYEGAACSAIYGVLLTTLTKDTSHTSGKIHK